MEARLRVPYESHSTADSKALLNIIDHDKLLAGKMICDAIKGSWIGYANAMGLEYHEYKSSESCQILTLRDLRLAQKQQLKLGRFQLVQSSKGGKVPFQRTDSNTPRKEWQDHDWSEAGAKALDQLSLETTLPGIVKTENEPPHPQHSGRKTETIMSQGQVLEPTQEDITRWGDCQPWEWALSLSEIRAENSNHASTHKQPTDAHERDLPQNSA
jgi:hypothetical protein